MPHIYAPTYLIGCLNLLNEKPTNLWPAGVYRALADRKVLSRVPKGERWHAPVGDICRDPLPPDSHDRLQYRSNPTSAPRLLIAALCILPGPHLDFESQQTHIRIIQQQHPLVNGIRYQIRPRTECAPSSSPDSGCVSILRATSTALPRGNSVCRYLLPWPDTDAITSLRR